MRLEVTAVFFVFHAYFGFIRAAQDHGETRMDDNEIYFEFQEIIKAFNRSEPPWLYGYNIEARDASIQMIETATTVEQQCTYFKTIELNSTNVKFSKYQMVQGKMEPKLLYGTFFQTPGRGKADSKLVNRTTPNGVSVSDSPGGTPEKKYKLLFSDYKDCSLIRPFFPDHPRQDYRGASYEGTEQVCIVLLSDKAARKMGTVPPNYRGPSMPRDLPGGLPDRCAAIYPNICGVQKKFTVVFNKSCPEIPNTLGC